MNRLVGKHASYLVFVLLIGMFTLWGCPKKTEVATSPEAAATNPEVQREEAPAAEQALSEQSEKAGSADEQSNEKAVAAGDSLQPVYFDFDQAFIRPEAGEIMKANAEWMKAHPQARIKIEGNCDERGAIEYNQALGQRRTASAKRFLTDSGISADRISLISYGKEKPGCTESMESCWQKNRRDDFVVID